MTVGVISATGRSDVGIATYENFIQTDASINPGNSGGPLVNLKGEVVGINTAIVAAGQGIGFAIPINMVKRVVDQLVDKGKVIRGWIGVSLQPLSTELAQSLGLEGTQGAVVGSTISGGPAAHAGLQQGDVILTYNKIPVEDYRHVQRLVAETAVGRTVTVEVLQEETEGPGQPDDRRGARHLAEARDGATPEGIARIGDAAKAYPIRGIRFIAWARCPPPAPAPDSSGPPEDPAGSTALAESAPRRRSAGPVS